MKRDLQKAVIGGVCAGIAQDFNIDPLVVRLIFVLAALAGFGLSFILYIVLWILLPTE